MDSSEQTTIDAIFTALNNETSANCELIVRNKSNGNAKKMDFSVLRNLFGVAKSSEQLLVDLGLPSGILWATRNIDVTRQNGFAESPYQYECSFFSWGNTEGKNPISNSAFDYNWGSANDGPYANTPGAALTGDAGLGYDAARTNLGGPWRMPTTANFAELFNSSYTKYVDANGDEVTGTNKLVTVNGVVGIRLMSLVNGKTIFFPCSGYGDGTSWKIPLRRVGAWASTVAVSIRRATAIGSAASRCGRFRFRNFFRPTQQNKPNLSFFGFVPPAAPKAAKGTNRENESDL